MPTASNRPHIRPLIRIVQSRQNARVKELRAGFSRVRNPLEDGVSIEGFHLVEEALRAGLTFQSLFIRTGSENLLESLVFPDAHNLPEILELPPEVFSSAVATGSPQGIAALIDPPLFSLNALFKAQTPQTTPLLLVAAGLQDPGNFGTLIRSAEAFGATGLIALPGTVSHWNPKALRASSGSAFRLPVVFATEREMLPLLRANHIQILAATVDSGTEAAEINLRAPIALLIGNEGGGLSESLLSAADAHITIPCPGPVESLNAAVAGSVLLYEAARQRAAQRHNEPKKR